MSVKLTARQREILERMANGWALWHTALSYAGEGYRYMTQTGYRGPIEEWEQSDIVRLLISGMITRDRSGNFAIYDLTERGRIVLSEQEKNR